MQKKFLVNLALLLFLNFLIKPFWIFGIDRTVQNTVGLSDYGFYFTIFNFAFLFYILLDAGITNFNNRNIAQHVHLLNKHFSSMVILKFILCAVYVAVTFIVALIIGYKGQQLVLLAWVGFNHFLLSFILYLRSNISGMMMFFTDSLLSVLDRALMIVICAVLLWGGVTGGVFKIEWFVYAQTAAYLVTMAVAMIVVVRKAKFRKLTWNWPFFLVILKKSFPFAILVMLMAIYNRVDSVFIERLLGGEEGRRQSGIYAQAFRLLDAVNQFAWLTAVLLLPIYARMIKMKQELDKMVRLPFALLITSAIIIATGSYFYRTEIMQWLYPRGEFESAAEFADKLGQSASVYGILMFGFPREYHHVCLQHAFNSKREPETVEPDRLGRYHVEFRSKYHHGAKAPGCRRCLCQPGNTAVHGGGLFYPGPVLFPVQGRLQFYPFYSDIYRTCDWL